MECAISNENRASRTYRKSYLIEPGNLLSVSENYRSHLTQIATKILVQPLPLPGREKIVLQERKDESCDEIFILIFHYEIRCGVRHMFNLFGHYIILIKVKHEENLIWF